MLARGTTKNDEIKKAVSAQTISAMYGNASDFTDRKKPRDNFILTIVCLGESLAMNIGRNTTHHVVTGGHNGNRLLHRIHVSKGSGQLKNARQFCIQHFFTEMIELELDMISMLTAAPPFQYFQHHRSGNDIAPGEILGVRRIALHKSLAIFVDQIAAFTPAALRNQSPGAINSGRVKLPHFHVLHGITRAHSHADSVAGIDQSISC